MKVLVTGANGQLGQEIVEVFQNNWEVISTDNDNLDITDLAQVRKVLTKEEPDWIVHCAAWTDVEACAEDPKKALLVNGEGTRNVAEAAKKIGAKVIYISTNEVFDGKKGSPYLEDDQTNPINPYGVSKLAGEKFVQDILGEDGIVVRTSWVYGPKGKSNFPLKIIEAAKKHSELKVVDDEIATPTYASDLAKAIYELIDKNPTGVYHLVNEGFCSRYEWAKKILKLRGIEVNLIPIKLSEYKRKSTPPLFGVLRNTKAEEEGIKLPTWLSSLEAYIKNEKN